GRNIEIQRETCKNVKTVSCGNVELEKPGNGQNVNVWVKIMHENGDVLVGRQRLSFTINKGDVIKALEICVPLMHVQETALILTDSKFCSGRAASEASEMKPGSRLLLEVQLLSVSGTLLEVKSLAEQLELISSEREKGNRYFQSKNYDLAFLCYSHALKIIESNSKGIEEIIKLLEEKVKCYSNMAACHLNTGNLEEAFTCCDIVLQHEPQHCKALFRKGKVRNSDDALGRPPDVKIAISNARIIIIIIIKNILHLCPHTG
uniref:peptidylprolyl isomerase n=1 Tax=Callorhinchus milii TaxID=7868 RepID=A0A4W3JKY3_CALMI